MWDVACTNSKELGSTCYSVTQPLFGLHKWPLKCWAICIHKILQHRIVYSLSLFPALFLYLLLSQMNRKWTFWTFGLQLNCESSYFCVCDISKPFYLAHLSLCVIFFAQSHVHMHTYLFFPFDPSIRNRFTQELEGPSVNFFEAIWYRSYNS